MKEQARFFIDNAAVMAQYGIKHAARWPGFECPHATFWDEVATGRYIVSDENAQGFFERLHESRQALAAWERLHKPFRCPKGHAWGVSEAEVSSRDRVEKACANHDPHKVVSPKSSSLYPWEKARSYGEPRKANRPRMVGKRRP